MLRNLIPLYFILTVSLVIIGVSLARHGWVQTFTAEGLGLEMSTVLVHAFAATWLVYTLWQLGRVTEFWPLAALVSLFALRELDFNDWWFEPGVLEIELLFSDVPLWHKAVSVLMIVLVAYVLVRVLVIGLKPLWNNRAEPWSKWFVLLGLTILLSLLLDHPAKTARQLGFELSQSQVDAIVSVEEFSEFLMAVIVLLIICLYRAARFR